MTTVTTSNTTGAATGTGAVTPAKTGYAALGMADFLTLLTTQMKDQDPTQPVDNTQMVAQMAQFSSLAGINTTNSNLATTNSGIDATNATLAKIATTLNAILAAQQAANAAPAATPAAA